MVKEKIIKELKQEYDFKSLTDLKKLVEIVKEKNEVLNIIRKSEIEIRDYIEKLADSFEYDLNEIDSYIGVNNFPQFYKDSGLSAKEIKSIKSISELIKDNYWTSDKQKYFIDTVNKKIYMRSQRSVIIFENAIVIKYKERRTRWVWKKVDGWMKHTDEDYDVTTMRIRINLTTNSIEVSEDSKTGIGINPRVKSN
jgi:hypothetical protein